MSFYKEQTMLAHEIPSPICSIIKKQNQITVINLGKEHDAIASNIVFWLFLDPCFEWAGSARVDGHGS